VSAYDRDPRVRALGGDRYEVRLRIDNRVGHIRPAPEDVGGFWADLEGVGAIGQTYDTADEAIRSLIGDPQ
jgi:hypothetical protein